MSEILESKKDQQKEPGKTSKAKQQLGKPGKTEGINFWIVRLVEAKVHG